MKKNTSITTIISQISLILALFIVSTGSVSAHKSPEGCSGSGLGINLYTDMAQAHIGDIVSLSADVFNGSISSPIACDATEIKADIVTPDGQNHPLTLNRTSLSNGEIDSYSNVVTYTIKTADITAAGTFTVTATVVGNIHQNDTNSIGGSNQGLNVIIISTPLVPPPTGVSVTSTSLTPPPTGVNTTSAVLPPPPTGTGTNSATSTTITPPPTGGSVTSAEILVTPPTPPTPPPTSGGGGGGSFPIPTPTIVAVVTPIIITPSLPNAGFAPFTDNTPWNIFILSGFLILISTPLVIVLSKNRV